jgi:glyoxylase-like metal-dependent hydrolase (beta-lactamase superfamily II)
MALEIKRLHLASLQGVGGPQHALDDWRVVNRSAADALAELDLSPADTGLVINTHLHFDHCGQNAVSAS